ncbi:hypothetical protein Tco_0726723 [Tanacetum coccineum]|uniref:Uncharacterized protein n=1 Tax=Tanacetum coccineum TaxID=301880 RepID=A0ABQ4YIW8_9ASTR
MPLRRKGAPFRTLEISLQTKRVRAQGSSDIDLAPWVIMVLIGCFCCAGFDDPYETGIVVMVEQMNDLFVVVIDDVLDTLVSMIGESELVELCWPQMQEDLSIVHASSEFRFHVPHVVRD